MNRTIIITGKKPVNNKSPLAKLAAGDLLTSTEMAALVSCKVALKLEAAGMKHSKMNVCAAVKRILGLKGNKASVAEQFEAIHADMDSADGDYWQRSAIIQQIIMNN